MAPTAAAAGSPSLNRISVGIDITPKRWATAGCSSMFSFTIFRSSRSSAIWSSTGAIAWHGPHHSAQKSRSEEHTSELQSPCNLVCRLLLEKKKINHSVYILYSLYPTGRTPRSVGPPVLSSLLHRMLYRLNTFSRPRRDTLCHVVVTIVYSA